MGELDQMKVRMNSLRETFADALTEKTGRDYSFMKKGRGLFTFTGLEQVHVEVLKEKYGIYMTNSGRINITGLNNENLEYVVDAIRAVTKECSAD